MKAELDREILAFLLTGCRTLPLGVALGIWSRGLVPLPVALSLSVALACGLGPAALPALSGAVELAALVLRELSIGATFALALAFALESAAWVVSLSDAHEALGFLRARLAIPYALAAAWLALSLRAPAALLSGLAEGLRTTKAAGPASLREFALGVVDLLAATFATALGLALPLIVAVWLVALTCALVLRAIAPRPLGGQPALSGLLLTLLASLALVPIASRTPEAVRAAIESARTLTRALAR